MLPFVEYHDVERERMAMKKVRVNPGRQLRLFGGDHFQSELKRLHRRIMRLNALKSGSADVYQVTVKPTKVRAHTRGEHTRVIIKLKKG